MITKRPALYGLFILLFCFGIFNAYAQPTLPGIAGSADKGIVILSWVCQYDGVRSIKVLRSGDSTNISEAIGFVKKLDKGLQVFVDGHPEAGKNFYKLSIVFKSGLSWSSNIQRVYVDKASLNGSKTVLPANDSIQRFVVAEELSGSKKTIATTAVNANNPVNDGKTGINKDKKNAEAPADTARRHKVLISFDFDTSLTWMPPTDSGKQAAPPRKKITITFDDPSGNASTGVISRFIFTDPATGHIDMNLPDDVSTHHYSLKFYDADNHIAIEVPRINAPDIIIDKRNFRKNGIYKFVLRRDVVELESGYITIYPTP